MKAYKPIVLAVLDGFGMSLEEKGNPVAAAKKPNLDSFETAYPFTTLQTSGVAVGLPWGEAGNSEVGHLTMGAGRVIYHHLPRIIYSISDKSFFSNGAFLKAAEHVKSRSGKLHLLGLVSSGSVHSYIDHLYALLRFVEEAGVPQAFVHAFSDGKDSLPKEGAKLFATIEARMTSDFSHTKLASVIGRYYAMDRDERWERIQKTYELLTEGKGTKIDGLISEYLKHSYEAGLSDEFIEPGFVAGADTGPIGRIKEHDAIIFFNFREDSMREIAHAFVDPVFDEFPRKKVEDLMAVTMTEYEKGLSALAAFPPLGLEDPLSAVIAEAGLRQLHIAETEKYAHVTYFFNGGNERPFPGEDRMLVPSAEVARFDELPEMKTEEIANHVASELERYDFVLVNFANTDMVGHSGNFDAAVRAVEAVDKALGKVRDAVLKRGGVLIVTGDHGNIEAKRDRVTGEQLTEHSINPVPFYLVGDDFKLKIPRETAEIQKTKKEVGGILTDVAPTVLELLGLQKPSTMTGASLLGLLSRS